MSEALPETYILSIPGTDQTEELSRAAVLERMARGEITAGHWMWSPADEDWKQVSEIPSLRVALPPPMAPAAPPPAAIQTAAGRTSPLGLLGVTKTSPVTSAIAPAPAKKKKVVRRKKERGEDGFPYLPFIAAILVLVLFAVVALNYEFIDKPFDGNVAQSPFVLVQAHAHLGAFVQRDTLLIHVLPSAELKAGNFADFLCTLAQSTPPPPFGWKPYAVVEITPAWKGQYALAGADWHQLAQMGGSTEDQRRDFILDHLDDAGGHALSTAKGLTPEAATAARDRLWDRILATFQVSGT